MSQESEDCLYCGVNHVDGVCKSCRDEYCDECLSEKGLCPNCDGRAADAAVDAELRRGIT